MEDIDVIALDSHDEQDELSVLDSDDTLSEASLIDALWDESFPRAPRVERTASPEQTPTPEHEDSAAEVLLFYKTLTLLLNCMPQIHKDADVPRFLRRVDAVVADKTLQQKVDYGKPFAALSARSRANSQRVITALRSRISETMQRRLSLNSEQMSVSDFRAALYNNTPGCASLQSAAPVQMTMVRRVTESAVEFTERYMTHWKYVVKLDLDEPGYALLTARLWYAAHLQNYGDALAAAQDKWDAALPHFESSFDVCEFFHNDAGLAAQKREAGRHWKGKSQGKKGKAGK